MHGDAPPLAVGRDEQQILFAQYKDGRVAEYMRADDGRLGRK
jgi:hypothetical protein